MKRYIAVFSIMVMIFMFCGGSAFAYGQVGPEEKNNVRQIDNSGQFKVSAEDMYVDSGISEPSEVNQIRNHQTPWQRYAYGSSSRMAILVTDLKSDWLGLAHGLKSIGVPFVVTQDVQQAIQHKMVLAYPMLSGSTMSPRNMAALSAYAKSGGTLVAVQPLANSLQGLFGFIEAIPTRKHNTLSFKPESLTRTMDDPRERGMTMGTFLFCQLSTPYLTNRMTMGTFLFCQLSTPYLTNSRQ